MSNTVFENKDINSSVSGENTTYFFSKEKTTIGLTDNFIFKEISQGGQSSTIIYPHSRIDSYGVEVSEKKLWLILGGIIVLLSLFSVITGDTSGFGGLVLNFEFRSLINSFTFEVLEVFNSISSFCLEIVFTTNDNFLEIHHKTINTTPKTKPLKPLVSPEITENKDNKTIIPPRINHNFFSETSTP